MELNDLLLKRGISPTTTLVLRHRPFEPELKRVFLWLAAERPGLFNAYQQTQGPQVEAAMQRATHVASFIGHETDRALFVGLYRRGEWRPLTKDAYWQVPEHQELRDLGMRGFVDDRATILQFDLSPEDFYREWSGRLVVDWPGGGKSWWRWADRNQLAIRAIAEHSYFEPPLPPWETIVLSQRELQALPRSWRHALQQWRGVYFILDGSDGKGYVGSAYGADNILGRWMDYAANGHGGNSELRGRSPDKFLFSILQRVSPDLDAAEVIQIEATWKARLHTRDFGLNRN